MILGWSSFARIALLVSFSLSNAKWASFTFNKDKI